MHSLVGIILAGEVGQAGQNKGFVQASYYRKFCMLAAAMLRSARQGSPTTGF